MYNANGFVHNRAKER